MILGIDASRAVKTEKTGVEWYSYFLLRAMEKCTPEGWRVKCYTPILPSPDLAFARSPSLTLTLPSPLGRGVGGEGNWQWRPLKWAGKGWTQGRLSLEMMKSPPDVLFVPSHVIPLVHPERTVTTVHDIVFVKHPELYDPKDLEAQRRGLGFALKFAKRIIVPSRATRDDVVAAGGRPEQIAVVPHGVDMANGYLLAASAPPEAARIANSRYILFIGRIERKKNVLGLIHAFRRLVHNPSLPPSPDLASARSPSPLGRGEGEGQLKLVLAGPLGYGGEDVLQAIKTFKLQDRVVQLGWVDRASYRSLLHNAALLILPSFGEGFGLPVLEAMTVGTPVVCSDIPVLHEVGGNAVQYVNPRDPEDIVRGIGTVLKNEMLVSEMTRKGKELAANYTWEKAACATWEIIESA